MRAYEGTLEVLSQHAYEEVQALERWFTTLLVVLD